MSQIEDGKGSGRRAGVDDFNRLLTSTVTRSELRNQVFSGKTWNVSTGLVPLTTDNPSSVLFFKNTGSESVFIDLYVVIAGDSTGGTGVAKIRLLRNPTGGTIVSKAVTVPNIVNMNFSSAYLPSAQIYLGGDGDTLTGHDGVLNSQTSAGSQLRVGILTSIPQGSSVGVEFTPPTGNTSMDVEISLEIFEEETS